MSGSVEELSGGDIVGTLQVHKPAPGVSAPTSEEEPTLGSTGVSFAAPIISQIELRHGQTLRLGRASSNDLIITDPGVSRFHAAFNASKTGIVVSDLASLNGTFVNGRRLTIPVDLHSGDIVTLGDTKIIIEIAAPETNPLLSQDHTQLSGMRAVDVTILLADICGYTTLSQQLPPEDVMKMVHSWFERVSKIVKANGGEVDKFIGDCMMAIWIGTHSEATPIATKAVNAGTAILEMTDQLSVEGVWPYHDRSPWRCRVAVNSGTAMMGTVAGGRSRDFTVLGDSVNVAFRLEKTGSRLQKRFIISETTAQLVNSNFPLVALGAVDLDGRTGAVEIFTLQSLEN